MGRISLLVACGLFGGVLSGASVLAQVFDPGPSDPALFDSVINLPPDPDIGPSTVIGGDGQTTQLNVADGGSIGDSVAAVDGAEVNISGGVVGDHFNAFSEVNISGGVVGDRFDALTHGLVSISGGRVGDDFQAIIGSEVHVSGGIVGNDFQSFGQSVVTVSGGVIGSGFTAVSTSEVTISGGTFGVDFNAFSGSDFELIGDDFRLNGAEFSDQAITIGDDDVFAGTLADGSTFIFSRAAEDTLAGVKLTPATPPTPDLTPMVLTGPSVGGPYGLRPGQTLTVQQGGELRTNFAAIDATLNVDGGLVVDGVETDGSIVNVTGGSLEGGVDAYVDSEVNVSGGSVSGAFHVTSGSEVNISGGQVESWFTVSAGSQLNINGGEVRFGLSLSDSSVNVFGGDVEGSIFAKYGSVVNLGSERAVLTVIAGSGSEVNVAAGRLRRHFWGLAVADVELFGGEFQLNGAEYSGGSITLAEGDVFTGTLQDGSSFIFSPSASDILQEVTLTAFALPALDATPKVVNGSTVSAPLNLRAGQTLTVLSGGELTESFAAVGATLNVQGGAVGEEAEVAGATVNISSGSVGDAFHAYLGSVVNINGGSVGDRFGAFSDSVVNITGGAVGELFEANSGSVVNISGGSVGPRFIAQPGSVVSVSGGAVGDFLSARADSIVSVSDGTVGDHLNASSGAVVNVSGGSVGDEFEAGSGSVVNLSGGALGSGFEAQGAFVNISGGSVGAGFAAASGTVVNLFGFDIRLDGDPLESLTVGEAVIILDRDVRLSGTLTDGSPFSFDLSTGFSGDDFFSASAILTVTLVESGIAGDYNNDGVVDAEDYVLWRDVVGMPEGSLFNDPVGGAIGPAHYEAWRANFGATVAATGSTSIPEPTAIVLTAVACLTLAASRTR